MAEEKDPGAAVPSMAMQRRESLTNQILYCARTTGRSQSLPFLVEDAQVLYRKLSTVAIDRGLETVAPARKISSSMCVRVMCSDSFIPKPCGNLLSGLQ